MFKYAYTVYAETDPLTYDIEYSYVRSEAPPPLTKQAVCWHATGGQASMCAKLLNDRKDAKWRAMHDELAANQD